MKGNMPVRVVTRKLIRRGVKAESNPFSIEIISEMNIKSALMINALPMFVDIALMFISLPFQFS